MGLMTRLFGPNISKLESKGEIDALVAVVESEAATEHRVAAIEALARLDPDQTAEALISALGSAETDIARAAEVAVAGLGTNAVGALVAALGTPLGERALAALLALDEAAVEPLIEALGAGDEPARLLAMAGLMELRQRLTAPASETDESTDESTDEGGTVDERVFRAMLAALGDRAPACRVLAAESLETLADARASRALAAQLKDGDEAVRTACRQALGRIGEPVVPDLVDALRDRNANSRRLAADLLGEICTAGPAVDSLRLALEALLDRTRDSDAGAREAVSTAIACVRSEDLERLIDSLLELLAHPELGEPDEPLELLRQLLAYIPLGPGRKQAILEQIVELGLAAEPLSDE